MEEKELTYTEALAEVERILERIQHEEITVDTLAAEVKRATGLLARCKKQLLKSEKEVEKILEP